MEKIFYLCPDTYEQYLYLMCEVAPRLDNAGVSFHICRPEEPLVRQILADCGKEVIQ